MSSYFKNILPMEFYRYLSSNKEAFYDAINNFKYDIREQNLFVKPIEMYGIVLSGRKGLPNSTERFTLNQPYYKTIGDELPKLTVKVKVLSNYQDSELNLPTSMLLDPFEDGLTDDEVELRIYNYPEASVLSDDVSIESLTYGTIVSIVEIDGRYFIDRNCSSPVIFDGLLNIAKMSSMQLFNSGAPLSDVVISDSTAIKIEEFIELLKKSGYFKEFTAESICGMIANAQHESNFRTTIGGDPPSHWLKARKEYNPGSADYERITNRYNRILKFAVVGHGYAKKPQPYCSWGYWQLQICTKDGAGTEAATRAGIDTTTEDGKKAWAAWVADPNKQFEYINYKLKSMGLHNINDAQEAGKRICAEFERPASKDTKCPQRGMTSLAIWKKYENKIKEIVTSSPASGNYLPTAEEITNLAFGTE